LGAADTDAAPAPSDRTLVTAMGDSSGLDALATTQRIYWYATKPESMVLSTQTVERPPTEPEVSR